MRKTLEYCNKKVQIKAYNTEVEKELLLYSSIHTDDFTIDGAFEIIEHLVTPGEYTELEKKMILLELRNLSVGESIDLRIKCQHCERHFDNAVMFTDVLTKSTLEDYGEFRFNDVISSEYNDYVNVDIDELDIDVYDEVCEYIEEHKTKISFQSETICLFCKTPNKITLGTKLLLENMSEDTIESFYKTTSSMIYFGNYSKADIDSMLPFERSIYLSMLNQQIEENNKAKGAM